MNNRRKLIMALGAGALATPFGCFAQQPARIPRIGYLSATSPAVVAAFTFMPNIDHNMAPILV